MPESRPVPYGAFNFLVGFEGSPKLLGGCSDVSGLMSEIKMAEYREGNYPENHVRKIPGTHTVGDVTLKRGLIDSKELWTWIGDIRKLGVSAKKNLTITLLDESAKPVQKWILRSVAPMKYTGPTLAAKGGGDVAMEELVLSSEGLEVAPA